MSATAFPHPHPRTAGAARPARVVLPAHGRAPDHSQASDHGYLAKIVAGALLIVAVVALTAPAGWAILPLAAAVLIATTAGVLHATLRLLDEPE